MILAILITVYVLVGFLVFGICCGDGFGEPWNPLPDSIGVSLVACAVVWPLVLAVVAGERIAPRVSRQSKPPPEQAAKERT